MSISKDVAKIGHLGFQSLIKKALEIGVDVHFYKNHRKLIRLSYKGKTVYTNGHAPPLPVQMGRFTVSKKVTKTILGENNISVPRGISAKTKKRAIEKIKKENLSYPLILKPIDGSMGRGVTWDITSQKEVLSAIDFFKEEQEKYSSIKRGRFIVEEMFIGDEYRVLVLKNKVISCVKKVPATVIGDGKHTIEELVADQNKKRLPDFPVKIDEVAEKTLQENDLTLESVLPKNHELKLRNDMMLGNGGRSIDCTHIMDKKLKNKCVKAVKSLGLAFGGIDILSADITSDKDYSIIEVNGHPFYVINEKPLVEGEGTDVSLLLLQEIFPKLNQK